MEDELDEILKEFEDEENRQKGENEEQRRKRLEEERDELYSNLPSHCHAFQLIKDPKVKKSFEPPKVTTPEACFASCPRVVPRAEWRARAPHRPVQQAIYRLRPAVFKETDGPDCDEPVKCAHVVYYLQNYQMDYLHYNDIAYSFLIATDGTIYEGRGWGKENEAAEGFAGIGYLGHFSNAPLDGPTEPMLQATYDLIMCGVRKGFLTNPFTSEAYSAPSIIEMMREFVKQEENIDYRTKVEDLGLSD